MANKNIVIAVAAGEIGYLEKKSNSNLDDKTANAGSANWTKYGRDMCKITPVYGTHSAWCDCFIDWCFVKAYGEQEAKQLLGGFSGYTPTSANYFKTRNQWYTTPQIGDIIFFKNSQRICHTGIVYEIKDGYVYTIEGNTTAGAKVIPNGGAVCAKAYLPSNTAIAGYGRPLYSNSPVVETPQRNENYFYGIDISSYQGNIDGATVKQSVDFVILRSVLQNLSLDLAFEYNYNQCVANNIPVGVYKFSYALTPEAAAQEGAAVLNAIKDKNIQCGVWLDLEWANQRALGENAISAIAEAFMVPLTAAGYKCGIYCNLDWYKNVLDTERLDYPYWIARYPANDNGTLQEEKKPEMGVMWQYSSKGKITGINATAVDMNVAYADLTQLFKVEKPQEEIDLVNRVSAYHLYVRTGPDKIYSIVKSIPKGTIVQVTKVENEWLYIGEGWVSSKYIDAAKGIVTAHTLNIRQEPNSHIGTKILGVYKKDNQVSLLAEKDGWYLTPRGWVSGKYIKRA